MLSTLLLLASARPAHADVAPPPTLVLDFLWLGVPVGPIVGFALIAMVVVLCRRMRKAGWGRFRTAGIAIFLFAACNLLCYVIGFSSRRPRRPLPNPGSLGEPTRPVDSR